MGGSLAPPKPERTAEGVTRNGSSRQRGRCPVTAAKPTAADKPLVTADKPSAVTKFNMLGSAAVTSISCQDSNSNRLYHTPEVPVSAAVPGMSAAATGLAGKQEYISANISK